MDISFVKKKEKGSYIFLGGVFCKKKIKTLGKYKKSLR